VSLTPLANLLPVSLIPVAICHQYHINNTNVPVVVHLDCQYLSKFWKEFEMTLMLFLGAWGKMNHETNKKQKILW
jgi:hypothetical protein